MKHPPRHRWFVLGALLIASFAVYLLGNGSIALWDRDEPRYVMASRYMLQHHDWIVPRIGWGLDPDTWRTAKPVLIYWCQAAAMKLFGPTPFAARFPSSVAMALTVLLVALGTVRLAGWRTALWTAGILATSALPMIAAKMSIIDAVLLLFVTFAQGALLYAYLAARRGTRTPTWLMALMWISISLAGLAKGPVVLGVMGTTLLALALLDAFPHPRRSGWRPIFNWWRHLRPLLGVVLIALIVIPPLWLLHQRAPGFLREQIFHDVLTRTRTALEGHKGPPGYYLATIWGTYFPWSLFLPLAIGFAWRYRRIPTVRFSLAAVVGPWIMFELVQTKLVHYVLPIFPFLAFLTARALVRCFAGRHRDLVNLPAKIGAGLWSSAVAILALIPWAAVGRFSDLPYPAMTLFTFAGLAWSITVFVLFLHNRPRIAALAMGVGMPLCIALLSALYLPRAGFLRLSQRLAAHLPDNIPPGQARMIGYKEQSLAFYQGGTIDDAPDNYLRTVPAADWPRYLVIQSNVWDRQPPEIQSAYDLRAIETGLNYAAGGKTVTVHVLEKRPDSPNIDP